MTEGVWIAIISNATTIIVVILGRWISHREHKNTERKVDELVNEHRHE